MTAYYNEIDPFAAAWLEGLVAAGKITPGRVDARSIAEVTADDVRGATRAHFFAGIGGWDLALQLAGWPADVPIWTGSCPCQSWSQAGARRGVDDERHLWPEWFRLIRECRPRVLVGEQVASPDALVWLDLVSADLEGAGYTVRAVDLCAAGVGAPHRRQRLWFCAVANDHEDGRSVERAARLHERRETEASVAEGDADRSLGNDAHGRSGARDVADDASGGRREGWEAASGDGTGSRDDLAHGDALGDPGGLGREGRRPSDDDEARASGAEHGSADADGGGSAVGYPSRDGDREHARQLPRDEAEHDERTTDSDHAPELAGATRGFWGRCRWIWCRDGKWRPVGLRSAALFSPQRVVDGVPGGLGGLRAEGSDPEAEEEIIHPLTQGESGRVGRLRGFGNAIVPQVAAVFLQAVMQTDEENET